MNKPNEYARSLELIGTPSDHFSAGEIRFTSHFVLFVFATGVATWHMPGTTTPPIDILATARYGISVAVLPMYSSVDDWKKVEGGGNRIPIVGPAEAALASDRNDGRITKTEDTTKADITRSADTFFAEDTILTEGNALSMDYFKVSKMRKPKFITTTTTISCGVRSLSIPNDIHSGS
jgi:hypothetical protein